jgi:isopentenyl-diphosphate delta-isomerase
MTAPTREGLLVELVSPLGEPVGSATVAQAHQPPGWLHRAFSVHILDAAGRLLLQRRAETKTRFPLRWANACCGHPSPGQPVVRAAADRLAEELGLQGVDLTEVGLYTYSAADPTSGLVEHEYDHVLLGIIDAPSSRILPDPAEVASLRWIDPGDLLGELRDSPSAYAPWLAGVTELAFPDVAPRR